jgi:hypothetical protein
MAVMLFCKLSCHNAPRTPVMAFSRLLVLYLGGGGGSQ